jgi:hypothetical protein
VLAPPFALLSAAGLQRIAAWIDGDFNYNRQNIYMILVAILLLSTLGGTVVLFELSGEFSLNNGGGTQVAADVSEFAVKEIPKEATILVPNGYSPPVKWYTRNDRLTETVVGYRLSSLSENQLRITLQESKKSVYLIAPSPRWNRIPPVEAERVYTTPTYDYTLLSIVSEYVETGSKLTYYLNDRQLVVYRVEASVS